MMMVGMDSVGSRRDPVRMPLSERLKKARSDAGMSQFDLAKATSIAPASISRYESGKVRPGIDVLTTLADGLRVSVSWLMTGERPDQEAEPGPLPEAWLEWAASSEVAHMDDTERATMSAIARVAAQEGFQPTPTVLSAWLAVLRMCPRAATRRQ